MDYSEFLESKKFAHQPSGFDCKINSDHLFLFQKFVVERSIHLWSNEGDAVLTPFAGIGSEVYSAIKLRRFGKGFELKKSYFDAAINNCNDAVYESKQKKLF